jgi:hypothetical protein
VTVRNLRVSRKNEFRTFKQTSIWVYDRRSLTIFRAWGSGVVNAPRY